MMTKMIWLKKVVFKYIASPALSARIHKKQIHFFILRRLARSSALAVHSRHDCQSALPSDRTKGRLQSQCSADHWCGMWDHLTLTRIDFKLLCYVSFLRFKFTVNNCMR
ncbi:hypothetical protein P5673_002005 [Acropora cervicornis]|uniref:Uncharacterized protein n=1 Tax=Acropora cervicornis TaxID=6130 RepID=A0AAD9R4K3_ACRCE|nr:hypothetical protein P5673_002005 [Acropora cervicornis]